MSSTDPKNYNYVASSRCGYYAIDDYYFTDEGNEKLAGQPPFPLMPFTNDESARIAKALNIAFGSGVKYSQFQAEQKERHQGYSNYETFVVAQWIDNDGTLRSYVNHLRANVISLTLEDERLGAFARSLKDYCEHRAFAYTQPRESMNFPIGSLINNALSQVDWLELATEYMKEEGQ